MLSFKRKYIGTACPFEAEAAAEEELMEKIGGMPAKNIK